MKYRYLHNPRCTKSRQGKALLEEKGVDFELVEYLKNPLRVEELRELSQALGLPPSQMVRTKEAAFKKHGLNQAGIDEEKVLQAVAEDPILLERPVLIRGKKAVIGRPTEKLAALLEGK